MTLKISFSFILLIVLVACNSFDNKSVDLKSSIKIKDTLSAEKITDEINTNIWDIIDINYYDKHENKIEGINKNDTFFVRLKYHSKKIPQLNYNYYFKIGNYSNNFRMYKTDELNKFKLVTAKDTDTIYYSLILKSNKYLFKKNRKIEDQLYIGQITECW